MTEKLVTFVCSPWQDGSDGTRVNCESCGKALRLSHEAGLALVAERDVGVGTLVLCEECVMDSLDQLDAEAMIVVQGVPPIPSVSRN